MRFLFVLLLLPFFLLAQKPTVQASGFKIEGNFAWKINYSLTIPSNVTGGLIFISTSKMTVLPVDGTSYLQGQHLGNAKVMRLAPSGFVKYEYPSLVANTKYYISVYTFNGSGTSIMYNTTAPLVDSITTKGKEIGTYYANLTSNSANFLSQLTTLINNHSFETYSNYIRVVTELYENDTVVSGITKKYLSCDYTNNKYIYASAFSFGVNKFNREHVLCKNWMNFRGIPNGDLVYYPEGSDYHNLLLTDGTVNSARSDDPLDIVVSNITKYGEAKQGKNASGKYCLEPRDMLKGNTARCQFYQMLCYNGVLSKNWGYNNLNAYAINENESVMKSWATIDTPDNAEIARNELIYALQGSRNPFIDFPDWINCISFKDISQLNTCLGLSASLSDEYSSWDVIYFVDYTGDLNLKFNVATIQDISLDIIDLQGKPVIHQLLKANSGENSYIIKTNIDKNKIYLMQMNSLQHSYRTKLINCNN